MDASSRELFDRQLRPACFPAVRSERGFRRIVGHSGIGVTENVYNRSNRKDFPVGSRRRRRRVLPKRSKVGGRQLVRVFVFPNLEPRPGLEPATRRSPICLDPARWHHCSYLESQTKHFHRRGVWSVLCPISPGDGSSQDELRRIRSVLLISTMRPS